MNITVDIDVPEGKFCGDDKFGNCDFLVYGSCIIFKVKSLKSDYIIRNRIKQLLSMKCNECLNGDKQ